VPHSLKHELTTSFNNNRRLGLRVIVVLLLGLTANILTPWPLKFIIDNVLHGGDLFGFHFKFLSAGDSKNFLIGLLAACSFLLVCTRGYFNHLRHILLTRLADRATDELRLNVFDHLLKVPTRSFGLFAVDDLRARANEDVERVRDCIIEVFAALAGEFVTIVITFIILFLVDVSFASLTAIFLVLLFAVYYFFPKSIDVRNTRARQLEADRAIFMSEIIRHQSFVKAWTREPIELRRLTEINRESAAASLEKAKGEGHLIFNVEILTALMTASILGYGGWSVSAGRLSVGDLVLFMQYLAFLYAPIGRASGFFLTYQRGRAGWQRIREVLELPTEDRATFSASKKPVSSPPPEIRFVNLSFGYRSEKKVFADFNLTIRAGEIAALVGPSGSGKSTLLKLLMGFYPLDSGDIYFGEESLTRMTHENWRRYVAYVDQEATLFSGTVRDNLVYSGDSGEEGVGEDRIRDVCRRLDIDSFVMSLPSGYETRIREDGVIFSTGQRQRLAIARALISKRPIVLMDEPTSALDSELERKLVNEFAFLLGGKTAILVTHSQKPLSLATLVIDLGAKAPQV
jgi:ABC-type multidrug transport system fused ATPase/permease subunit